MAICSIELWQSVMTDVVFVSEFNLSEDYLAKANKYLASLKRRIMNIAYANENFESAFIEAQQLVFKYNVAINNLLAEVFEPIRNDFELNVSASNLVPVVPVKVESIEAMVSRLQEFMRTKGYSRKTEKAYIGWIRKFIIYHGKQHPKDLTSKHVEGYHSVAIAPQL